MNCVTGFGDYSVCIGRYTSEQEAANALKRVALAEKEGEKPIYSMPLCTELNGQYLVEAGERQQWRALPGSRCYF